MKIQVALFLEVVIRILSFSKRCATRSKTWYNKTRSSRRYRTQSTPPAASSTVQPRPPASPVVHRHLKAAKEAVPSRTRRRRAETTRVPWSAFTASSSCRRTRTYRSLTTTSRDRALVNEQILHFITNNSFFTFTIRGSRSWRRN